MFFQVTKTDPQSQARLGVLKTARGEVKTPAFVPRYFAATARHYSVQELKFWGAEMLSVEAMDFWLRPGDALIHSAGGLHKFLSWTGPLLTRFSLDAKNLNSVALAVSPAVKMELSEGAVTVRIKSDSPFKLSPEQATQIQSNFGSDIATSLEYPSGVSRSRRAQIFAQGWRLRAKKHFEKVKDAGLNPEQKFFAAPEAGEDIDGFMVELPVKKSSKSLTEQLAQLPSDKPRYAPDAAMPDKILAAIACGVDLVDSTAPETYGADGKLFIATRPGPGFEILNIKEKKHASDGTPPDSACTCYVCRTYSRADLHRLFSEGDPSAIRFACMHNLNFYFQFLEKIRRAITYESFDELLKNYKFRK
jgi:queuine tRNA-ribosyltransferase